MVELAAERNITVHLRSAARIEPDRLPRLRSIGEDWARRLEARLNAFYASPLAVEPAGVASFVFAEDAPVVQAAAIAVAVRSPKWREPGFVLCDDRLAEALVEALFGGEGRTQAPEARPLTVLERQFVETAVGAALEAGGAAFEPVEAFGMAADRVFADKVATRLQDFLSEDNRSFVEFAFRCAIGRCAGVLRVCLPEAALAPHRRKLATVPEAPPSIADEDWARDIQAGLGQADLHVRALLDERSVTLGEVAGFAVGQTIELGTSMDSLIVVECEERRLFRGRIGRSRDAYVVRIEETIDPTEEFIDDILSD